MPKSVFWPAALVVMGLIYLASNMGLLPADFWNFWPIILIVVGLGGLLTADREEWMSSPTNSKTKTTKPTKKKVIAQKSRKK
ncbi:MAG: DUF5668 domain-containing protein [bacterium]|nr:DUF5668 domain-containing protein [bacterium]